MLKTNTTLKQLNIGENYLESKCCKEIFSALENNTTLTNLEFYRKLLRILIALLRHSQGCLRNS